jgi:hypothetical protein
LSPTTEADRRGLGGGLAASDDIGLLVLPMTTQAAGCIRANCIDVVRTQIVEAPAN